MTDKPLKLEKIDQSIVKFTLLRNLTIDDFRKLLGIISSLLDKAQETKVPFSFIVDARKLSSVPANAALNLITWLKKNRPRIKGNLLATSVVIDNSVVRDLLVGAFKVQPTVSPNLITLNIDEAEKFVKKHMT